MYSRISTQPTGAGGLFLRGIFQKLRGAEYRAEVINNREAAESCGKKEVPVETGTEPK